MKFELRHRVLFSDVGADFKVTLGTMLRLFQNVAAAHSESIGFGIRTLSERSIYWMLSKLWIEVTRYAYYGEELVITSWSRGANGFKMPRDFEIHVGGERVAAGSSIWFVVNTRHRKVERVPAEIDAAYLTESIHALSQDLGEWSPYERFDTTNRWIAQTRHSDLDAGGHVNNTVYVEYLLSSLVVQQGADPHIPSLKLQFNREIGPNVAEVFVETAETSGKLLFKISDGQQQVYARGELVLTDHSVRSRWDNA